MFFVYKLERGLIRRHFSVIKTKGIENKIKMLNYDFINFNSSVWWPEPVKYPFHGNGYFTSSYHHYHENDILPVPATLPHFVERLSYLNEIFSDPVKYPFHGNGYFTDHIRLIKYQRNVAGTGKIDTAFTLFTPKSRRDLPHDVRAGMDIHPLFDRLNFKCIENHGDVCIRYDWELLIREKITPRELFSSIPTLQSTKRQSRLFNVLKASLLNLRPPLTFYHILNLMYIYIYIYPHNMGVFGFYKSHIKWEFIFLIIFWMNIIPKSYIYLDLLISFENEKAADIFGLRNLLTVKYLLLNGTIFTRIIIICSINQCYKRVIRKKREHSFIHSFIRVCKLLCHSPRFPIGLEPLIDVFPLRSYLFCFLQGGDGFTNFGGWSSWTEWSSCSRSCDGGASSMTRKCLFNKGCRYGKLTRYRICNMQPCNDAKNFRDVQCSEYDNKLYNGQFHKWSVAPYNPLRPCALSCSSNRTSVVVEFASQVHDGTRCREGSLGMCISGSCMPVGCDLQLDSTKKIDECGVCGGDGSSCHQSSYHWYETGLSECSVSCGGAANRTLLASKNLLSYRLCDKQNTKFVNFGYRIYPTGTHYVGIFYDFRNWRHLPRQTHHYCIIRSKKTQFKLLAIQGVPELAIYFNEIEEIFKKCTFIYVYHCSVSCGSGYRTRSVYCKDADGLQNQSCDMTQKPAKRQRCVLTHICSPAQHRKLENEDRKASDNLPRPQQQNSASNKPRFVAGEWGECSSSNTCGWGFRQRQVRCKVYVEFSGEVILSDDDCSDSVKPLGKDKCFLRPCDDYISNTLDGSTCIFYAYTGVRESITECIRTKDDAVVSPTNCDLSTKPDQLIQTCNNRPCPPRWNISDFTPCTKNCGGGKQFRTVHCIHEVTRGNVLSVSNKLCPQPPPRLERLCGVISCPIKWKTGQWSQRMLMITVKKKKGIKYSSAHSKEQPFCFLIMLAKSLLNIIY
ncbi:A disintegrin and metalloproteinase with thrombospondin motifs 6 [Nymphon striatum]|nr:A disintegrin and metalloproteinase with thrombospondin motifs 6 [Nymphon striatum]